MSYWKNPPRAHLIAWAGRTWPTDATKFKRMKLNQLRAIWHRYNEDRYEKSKHEARAQADSIETI